VSIGSVIEREPGGRVVVELLRSDSTDLPLPTLRERARRRTTTAASWARGRARRPNGREREQDGATRSIYESSGLEEGDHGLLLGLVSRVERVHDDVGIDERTHCVS